jgi:superfamily I DNA/RNA helicase
VGDRSQAIYGFAGAQSDSMDKIKEATKAHELPLSVCYRCPTSHIDRAKNIVSQIEASPTASAGILAEIKESELTDKLTNGSLILCRKTAPLISLCLQLIGEGLPARVKGRDVASGLIKVIDKLAKDAHFSYGSLPLFVREWESIQMRKLADLKDSESRIQQVNDTASAIVAAYSGLKIKCSTLEQFKDALLALFDDSRASIWLSTIHKAKGLEAERVFIIKPQYLPLVWKGQQPWQFGQEKNLEYVAYTRSKSELYFVLDPQEGDKPTKQPVTIQTMLNGVLEQFDAIGRDEVMFLDGVEQ